MNLKSANKIDTNKYEVIVEVEADVFNTEVNKVYRREVKKINIPGFRKGKAPRAIIEKMYGESVFYEDAIQNLYPGALADAAEEAKLDIVGVEDISVDEAGKQGFTFKAVVFVSPEEVDINGYEGIKVEAKSTEVTEELVNEEIKKVRDRNSRLITVEDRPVKDGDIAVIDFEGFVDGEAFEGGKAESFNLTIGSGQFIPGFEEQIIGKSTGDEFTIDVTFPEEYQAAELAGKASQFKIKLHEIKEKELPEVDDEFVKDVSDKETVEEYREEIKGELAEKLQKEADSDAERQIIEKLCELLEAEIPEVMYENKKNDMLRDFDMQLRSQGLDLKTYLQYVGMSADDVKEGYKEQAEQRVKLRLALEKIAEKEGFTDVTDEELEAEYTKLADAYKMEADKVKEAISAEALRKDIAVEKAMDFVKESAIKE